MLNGMQDPLTLASLIAVFLVNGTATGIIPLAAQEAHPTQQRTFPIVEDNSFLLEEAYNQEERVVQHISSAVYFAQPRNEFTYTFTQEWPLHGRRHQLSFTVPYTMLSSPSASGIGDVYINYRLQLLDRDDWMAASPRLSVILPAGNADRGLGSGTTGFELNLPFSKRLSDSFISHWNAGVTFFPRVKANLATGGELRRDLTSYIIGASLIWLARPEYNALLECVSVFPNEIESDGSLSHSTEFIINPGFRFAINLGSLQIVPGVAFPLSFTETISRVGVFLYLSFEHPY